MSSAEQTWVAAVDLGATSVRVCVVDLETAPLGYEVIHRVRHESATAADGVLRWDWAAICRAVTEGLTMATEQYPLASIGIDTWAVDYGLLDAAGQLLAPPASYRDSRTEGFDDLVQQVGAERLYGINGLQCLPFNTIFQLAAEDPALLGRTRHILTLPELLIHHLTGAICAETTSAGSTGLVDQQTRTWSTELLDAINIASNRFPAIRQPGDQVGTWNDIPVHLVAGHDTASAVAGIGAPEGDLCFVSSGTWMLAGSERDQPVVTEQARAHGFTNEYGPENRTRFLKNIAGFWILEQCQRQWGETDVVELLRRAEDAVYEGPRFEATNPRFLAPGDMVAEVLGATGLSATTSLPVVVSAIVESLATSTATVLSQMESVTKETIAGVHLVGGGARSTQYVKALTAAINKPVWVGSVESAAVGNALMQGIGLGKWASLTEARKAI